MTDLSKNEIYNNGNIECSESFVFYESVYRHYEDLMRAKEDKLANDYLMAIIAYGLYGVIPSEDDELYKYGLRGDLASIANAKKKFANKVLIPKDEISELYNFGNGMTVAELAAYYDCSKDTIYRRLEQYALRKKEYTGSKRPMVEKKKEKKTSILGN